jgi:glycosyltransferase involved in cell wall biosynthesis
MRHEAPSVFTAAINASEAIDVSIVMPCLNEVQCLPHCIANARDALNLMERDLGLSGEIVIADNGSTDGSQALAAGLGARVVHVSARGYGAALIGGGEAAWGRFVLMGDADGSYDFTDGVAMIARLAAGADLCMGSRFRGGIARGAMPWKNRYIGNPLLTGILNLLFRAGVSDAHCGLRAIRKEALVALRLTGSGMEFASEMVIKAALRRLRVEETPAKLLADLRERPPHLRPWRDGWRHLRYLFMLSPTWLFGAPAVVGAAISIMILAAAMLEAFAPGSFPAIGNYWVVLAAGLLSASHLAGVMGMAGELYGVREGYRLPMNLSERLSRHISLEVMLLTGFGAIIAGLCILGGVIWFWGARDFAATYSVLPAVLGTLCLTLGCQNALGGFLLAIIAGNEARFLARPTSLRRRADDPRLFNQAA